MPRSIRVDALTLRLAVGATLLVVIPLGLGLYLLSRDHLDRTVTARRHAAEMQNRIIETTLRHNMIAKDTSLIREVLHGIGAEPEVDNVMILDHQGKVHFASREELVGKSIDRESPTCHGCHAVDPEDRKHWVILEEEEGQGQGQGQGKNGKGRVLRTVLPIENRKECHECHAPDQRYNGMLVLDVSLAGLDAQIEKDTGRIVAGTAVLAGLLLAGLGLIVRQLILVRLARLGRAARAIAAGKLEERAELDGDDVITKLALDFNNMAGSVSKLVQEVRDQESQLANVLNSLDDGLVVLDREYRVLASNQSFCRRFGAHPEMLRGRSCHEHAPCAVCGGPGDKECPTTRCLVTGEGQRAVFQIPSSDPGASVVEEVYASPVFDAEGKVVQVVEVWRDISARVKEEERLAEIERLVSLGVLASGFSHEMNTPLASMLTCAEAAIGRIDEVGGARDAESLIAAVRAHADTIRKEVLRCRKITERFLRFSRGIPPTVEPIDLREVVESVVALAAPTAREGRATIRVEGGEPLPAVKANVEVVQHVVLNLLVNAIQSFDGKGGTVTLRFHVGEDVRLEVKDDGCGIPPEVRKHLFEPFRSQKPHGTGLGLFLSRNFVRRFGGELRLARSEAGAGSCFEVVFPRAGGGGAPR